MQRVYALMQQAAEATSRCSFAARAALVRNWWLSRFTSTVRASRAVRGSQLRRHSETLIESELFGHERGAFTGDRAETRAFERAVGVLPCSTRSAICRMSCRASCCAFAGAGNPAGGRYRLHFRRHPGDDGDHKDLDLLVRRGEFRQDLFNRVAAFPIENPPLRERREDIPCWRDIFSINTPNAPISPSVGFHRCSAPVAPARLARQRARTGECHRARRVVGDRRGTTSEQSALQLSQRRCRKRPLAAGGGHAAGRGRAAGASPRPRSCGQQRHAGGPSAGFNRSTLHRKLKK